VEFLHAQGVDPIVCKCSDFPANPIRRPEIVAASGRGVLSLSIQESRIRRTNALLRGAALKLTTCFRIGLKLILVLAFLCVSLAPTYAQKSVRELHTPYQKWLDEDVRWIITDQERADFKKLLAGQQRDEVMDAFIEAFWERRNPVPGSPENGFKEEHYRRVAYANQHFAEGIAGWRTDRGRFYIVYGPPDKVVRHLPSDKAQPGGGLKNDFPSEEWRWGHIDGVGRDVTLRFVDTCGCGEYHLTGGENK
jgi:GWxTD domain-containing protein